MNNSLSKLLLQNRKPQAKTLPLLDLGLEVAQAEMVTVEVPAVVVAAPMKETSRNSRWKRKRARASQNRTLNWPGATVRTWVRVQTWAPPRCPTMDSVVGILCHSNSTHTGQCR